MKPLAGGWLFILFGLTQPLDADTVTLRNGSKVEGTILAFKNQKFEFESEKGSHSSYAPIELQRIDFKIEGEESGSPATLTHRIQGQMNGTVLEYAGGNFKLRDAKGNETAVPAMLVTSATFAGGGGKKIEVITHGRRVDIEKSLARGKVTLVDFYADWCGPCRMISPYLEKLANQDPAVVLRKVDIVEWRSEVCKQYQIQSVPQIWVYDKQGKLVGKVTGASSQKVDELVAQAKR